VGNKENLIIIIDSALKQEFRISCIKDNRNMTEVVTELIETYLKEK